ncbi:ROK family transcriptional regulator [Cohnella zeiphila]|uniref:ROK family transcriptional regulator n=1 Tax=Cohnella zeiphila TaxID=2761120 RepID=A0A7X0SP62_9BACL|nr:ROK family transcriptional regulator [Cohnella zeiphila]MBB6733618.1 ROK family transcriptional regulator [Cohnella zeiphila]
MPQLLLQPISGGGAKLEYAGQFDGQSRLSVRGGRMTGREEEADLMVLMGHNISRSKQTNKRTILRCLLRYGPISRQRIAEITSLTPATISNLISELIEENLILETGHLEEFRRRAGRKSVALAFHPQACNALAVHMNAREVHFGLAGINGTVRTLRRYEISFDSNQSAFIERLLAETDACIAELRKDSLSAIGVGLVGFVNFDTGTYLSREHLGWKEVPLAALLAERHGLPVYADNNIRTMALAEKMFGVGRTLTDFLLIYIGPGIGSGLVAGDRLYRGGSTGAGEFGHMTYHPEGPACYCGNRGCLERYASLTAIAAELQVSGVLDPLNLLKQGDRQAHEAVARAGRRIGTVLASYLNMFHVPKVIVAGPLAGESIPLLEEIRRELYDRSPLAKRERVEIVGSELGENIGLVGAAALALWNEIFEHRRSG